MAEVEIRSHIKLGLKEILEGISELEVGDIESFLQEVSDILAKKKRQDTTKENEALLIKEIEKTYPQKLNKRYQELSAKIDEGKLTDQEQKELLDLTDHFEALDAQRLQHLMALSKLKGISLPQLLQNYPLPPRTNA